ncbi:MAG: helix-turn-helix domain-containing protein [Bacteroidota bacterium]
MESLHFLPLVIYLLSKSSFYFLDADTKLASIADGSFRDYGFPTINMAYFAMLQMSTYGAVSIISKTKNKTAIPKENAIWTNFLITAFFGYLLCFITYFIRIPLGYYSLFSDYIICYFIVLFVGSVAYFGIVQPHIFEGPLTMKKYIPFTKYERTGLSKGYSIELKKELQRLMEQEKPYLDSDIRLDDLAEMLDVPRHHASQIINENFNSNFFDFMNQYRIREAELALKDKNSGITIQKIAYQSGFNNRVSFYKAFKKVTGMTPSQYKNK